MPKKLEASILF